ncbi:MAG TPA: FAD-binding oxidoreductase [Chloroflexaceae bacterium]|nr:FAD-binding oxidoreductase [Chloroflexaceae bacterium]
MSTSHWHATLERPPLPDDEPPARAEVAVVGGGVLGAMAAYWLARAGARPVLIERGGPAAGASGHNGGLCSAGTAEGYPEAVARVGRRTARDVWALSRDGVALLQAVVAEEGIECQLRPTGNLGLALDEGQLATFGRAAAMLREDGFGGVELLDRDGAAAALGAELGPEVVGGKLNRDAASLHSARLVHGVLAAAARRGARLCWGAEARALRAAGGLVVVETSRGAIEAGAAVVAVNAWGGDLLPGLAGVITPVRGQALATARMAPTLRRAFGASLTPTGEYGQQTPDGAVIFGGCRAVAPGRDVGAREMVPTEVVQAAIEGALGRLFPALAGVPVERRWAGLMGFTADYLPVAGAAPGAPGVWFAGGFCGHGMPFAAPLGRLLAEAALAGVAPAGLAPLSLGRASLAL